MRNKIDNAGYTSYSKVQNLANLDSFEHQLDIENLKHYSCIEIPVKNYCMQLSFSCMYKVHIKHMVSISG